MGFPPHKSFASLSEDSYSLLMSIAEPRRLVKGEVLLHESQVCKHIYFVESGYLKTVHNNDGKEVNLSFTFPGSFTTNLKSLRTGTPSE
ncbi:MAG: Crp/Fnr family transcriptional regulator, partial [Bacteroidetes bacterium]|nr:Crp/Fnr family transcriptional regulator [Bacteroidota bacterium]